MKRKGAFLAPAAAVLSRELATVLMTLHYIMKYTKKHFLLHGSDSHATEKQLP